jgi:hypothetical protein
VAEITGAEPNEELVSFIQAARRVSKLVVYPPGRETKFLDVHPVIANHVLTVDSRGARHERFYPFDGMTLPGGFDAGYDQFTHHFGEHVRLLMQGGATMVSLSGGFDSRSTQKAMRPWMRNDTFAWTYIDLESSPHAVRNDLLAANRIAVDSGMLHRIVRLERSSDARFVDALRRSFPLGVQAAHIAGAVWDDLSHEHLELISMVAAIGTGFYEHSTELPDATRLARMYSSREHGGWEYTVDAFARFIEYADFTPDAFGPLDHHDLLYWESRSSRWSGLRMQELEMSHPIASPFNSRRVLEGMLGAPYEERASKQMLSMFLADSSTNPAESKRAGLG